MRRIRLLAAVAVTAAGVTACGAEPGQADAQAACRAYANTMRHPVATTAAGNDATWATARADARRAVSAGRRWAALQRDIEDFRSRLRSLSQTSTPGELDAYFAADRRVQADCTAAGEDIGPLKP